MTRIAFIGLGNMGCGMAARQVRPGARCTPSTSREAAVKKAVAAGARRRQASRKPWRRRMSVITMLPAGQHVRKVYDEHIVPQAPRRRAADRLLDDRCRKRALRRTAKDAKRLPLCRCAGLRRHGGGGRWNARLHGRVRGKDFAHIEETLKPMSRVTIRAGDHGAGQAAKICNNMLLGISMIGTCEAFALAEKLGLDAQRFFEIASKSSGQCWSLSTYCPWPGPVPADAVESQL